MKTLTVIRAARAAAIVGLMLGAAPSASRAQREDTVPFPVAELFFELNNTDGDLGIHGNIDGAPTRRLVINAPRRDRAILDISARESLRRQGLSFVGFESAEPSFDELPPRSSSAGSPKGSTRSWAPCWKAPTRRAT